MVDKTLRQNLAEVGEQVFIICIAVCLIQFMKIPYNHFSLSPIKRFLWLKQDGNQHYSWLFQYSKLNKSL